MFVGVNVRRINASAADLLNLREQFPLHVLGPNSSRAYSCHERGQGGRQTPVPASQCGNLPRWRHRKSSDEYQVTSDSQPGIGPRALDCVLEGWAIGHQGGAGQDSLPMRADNPFVDPSREAEIVCVENQFLHGLLLRVSGLLGEPSGPKNSTRHAMQVSVLLGDGCKTLCQENFLQYSRLFHPSAERSSNFRATCPLRPQKDPGQYEWCVKVFNSSVENHVEKAGARIETAHYYEAFSYLHKFCADFAPANPANANFTQSPCLSLLLFREREIPCEQFQNETDSREGFLVPVRWRRELDRNRFLLFLHVVPLAEGMPARGNDLNHDLALRNRRDLH